MTKVLKFRSDVEKQAWRHAEKLDLVTWEELHKRGVSQTMSKQFIRRWFKAGYLELRSVDEHRKIYAHPGRVVKTVEPDFTCRTAEDAMWIVMCRHRTFTIADLVNVGSVGDIEVTNQKARRYCKVLMRFGYVRPWQTGVIGKKDGVYRLINRSGPSAPHVRRVSGLFDPNEDRFEPFDEGATK